VVKLSKSIFVSGFWLMCNESNSCITPVYYYLFDMQSTTTTKKKSVSIYMHI